MGEPKQLLPWEGATLIEHCVKQATSVCAEAFVVLGAAFDLISERLANYSINILNNTHWQAGQGSSISFGMKEILKRNSFDGVLIMLADQPQVDSNYLSELVKKFSKYPNKIIATSYVQSIGVPAIFAEQHFDSLLSLSGDRGAKRIIMENVSSMISIKPEVPISDIDSIEDYLKLYKEFH